MYKDNAVGNVVAETGRDLVLLITAQLSDLSMPLKGAVRRSPEQSAWQPIARSFRAANLYDVLLRGGRWVVKKRMLSPIVEHTFERGLEEGRFDVAYRSETPKTTKLPKPQTATVATALWPK